MFGIFRKKPTKPTRQEQARVVQKDLDQIAIDNPQFYKVLVEGFIKDGFFEQFPEIRYNKELLSG